MFEISENYGGTLHVYSPIWQHADAIIAGDREGLLSLRDAIDRALEEGKAKNDPFCSDGEGFTLHVVQLDDSEMEHAVLPYVDESEKKPWSMEDLPWRKIYLD